MIGLGLFDVAASYAATNWGVAMGTIIFMTLFSQYLRDVAVPLPVYRDKKCQLIKVEIFKLFPVLMTILAMWSLCAIITVSGGFSEKDPGRTDLKLGILNNASWFRFPYPCKFKRCFYFECKASKFKTFFFFVFSPFLVILLQKRAQTVS